jgi:hypothetical protein
LTGAGVAENGLQRGGDVLPLPIGDRFGLVAVLGGAELGGGAVDVPAVIAERAGVWE